MAIIRLGPLVAAISGSLGSSTFRTTKFGPVVAARGLRPPGDSIFQRRVKSAYSVASRLWWLQDDATRLSWNIAAEVYSKSNRLGQRRGISGNQYFIGYCAWNGGTPYASTYLPPVYSTPPVATLTATEASDYITVAWALAANPGVNVRVRVWGFRPNSKKSFSSARSWTPLYVQTGSYSNSVNVNAAAWPSGLAYTPGEFVMFKVSAQAYGFWRSSPQIVSLSYIAP